MFVPYAVWSLVLSLMLFVTWIVDQGLAATLVVPFALLVVGAEMVRRWQHGSPRRRHHWRP